MPKIAPASPFYYINVQTSSTILFFPGTGSGALNKIQNTKILYPHIFRMVPQPLVVMKMVRDHTDGARSTGVSRHEAHPVGIPLVVRQGVRLPAARRTCVSRGFFAE
jgi:hypothetical protein